MLLFGFGDGGGGPNTEMLEKLRRFSSAALPAAAAKAAGQASGVPDDDSSGIGGAAGELPSVTIGCPNDFFRDLEKNSRDLLTWFVD